MSLHDFVPIEHRDLDLRGLTGDFAISTHAPGRHDLHLVWNADGEDTGALRKREYRIPFWFMPRFDQSASGR